MRGKNCGERVKRSMRTRNEKSASNQGKEVVKVCKSRNSFNWFACFDIGHAIGYIGVNMDFGILLNGLGQASLADVQFEETEDKALRKGVS